jgi:hypothetical protein
VVPFPPSGLPFFGLIACLDFSPCTLFLSLSLSWVPSFHKVWQGFIIIRNKAYYVSGFPLGGCDHSTLCVTM